MRVSETHAVHFKPPLSRNQLGIQKTNIQDTFVQTSTRFGKETHHYTAYDFEPMQFQSEGQQFFLPPVAGFDLDEEVAIIERQFQAGQDVSEIIELAIDEYKKLLRLVFSYKEEDLKEQVVEHLLNDNPIYTRFKERGHRFITVQDGQMTDAGDLDTVKAAIRDRFDLGSERRQALAARATQLKPFDLSKPQDRQDVYDIQVALLMECNLRQFNEESAEAQSLLATQRDKQLALIHNLQLHLLKRFKNPPQRPTSEPIQAKPTLTTKQERLFQALLRFTSFLRDLVAEIGYQG